MHIRSKHHYSILRTIAYVNCIARANEHSNDSAKSDRLVWLQADDLKAPAVVVIHCETLPSAAHRDKSARFCAFEYRYAVGEYRYGIADYRILK
jgi:hypothetical protein